MAQTTTSPASSNVPIIAGASAAAAAVAIVAVAAVIAQQSSRSVNTVNNTRMSCNLGSLCSTVGGTPVFELTMSCARPAADG